MLEFFRKYQRFFMLVVSVVVIISFTFFGTYGAMSSGDSEPDAVITSTIDGSKVKYSELSRLSRLLAAEEQMIQRQFLDNGVASILLKAYRRPLLPTFQSWIDKAKKARFYTHPVAKELSARVLWDRLCPGLMEAIGRMQTLEPEQVEEVVATWIEIHQLQKNCSADLVKKVLLYQQQQVGLPVDSRLWAEDVALFGNHSLTDWFGRDVIDLFSQTVLNGAAIARQHNVHVSKEEAGLELSKAFTNLDSTLRSIGVQQYDAVRLWQQALMYACDVKTISHALLVDDLAEKKMADDGGETADVLIYRLPYELRFQDEQDAIAFDAYTAAACEPFSVLPTMYKDIEQNALEFIAESISLSVIEVDLASLADRISLKDLWSWQLQDRSWASLRKAFPEFCNCLPSLESLEKLAGPKRAEIDAWSRQRIVSERPEMVERELSIKMPRKIDLDLYADGTFEGYECQNPSDFVELVQQVELLGEPLCYREPTKVVRVLSIDRLHEKRILSFAEAKSKGRIPVDRYLEEKYRQVRVQHPELFLDKQGEWLSYKQAHGKLIELLYPEKSYSKRFIPAMQEMLEQQGQGSLGLFEPMIEQMSVSRTASEPWLAELPFTQEIGAYSPLQQLPDGELAFFTVQSRSRASAPRLERLLALQEAMAKDVERQLAASLVDTLLQKEVVVLPVSLTRNEGDKHDDF